MHFHPHDLEQLAQRFKILSEPARLQILGTLCDQESSVQEICQRTGLHQANASKHLRLMTDAGVVTYRKRGIWRYYRILAPEVLSLCLKTQKALQSDATLPGLNNAQMEVVESS